jgi:hypothetical protein
MAVELGREDRESSTCSAETVTPGCGCSETMTTAPRSTAWRTKNEPSV